MGGGLTKEEKRMQEEALEREAEERAKKAKERALVAVLKRQRIVESRCVGTEIDDETFETVYFYSALELDAVPKSLAAIAAVPRDPALSGMKWVADDSDYIDFFEKSYELFDGIHFKVSSFALKQIFGKLVLNNMDSLLEFYCIQELSLTDYWEREHFKQAALSQIRKSLAVGRLHPVKIFASYLIPSKCVSELEVGSIVQESTFRMAGDGYTNTKFCQMAREVVDDGIKEFALNIVATRECLLEMRHFPTDLVPTLLSFLFFGSQALRRMKAPV